MSFSNVNIPTTSSVFAVDAQQGPNKIILLPNASNVPGRFITIKDYFGSSGSSTIYISSTVGNSIDIYNSTITMSTSYQSMSFLSDGLSNWSLFANQTGPIPVIFSPSDLGLPAIWFDASQLSNITYDQTNCNVTSWSNRGSNAVSADSNGIFGGPPKTLQYTQNGLNVITYNTSNGLQIPYMSLEYGEKTCFAVYCQLENVTSGKGMSFVEQQNGYNFNDFSLINVYGNPGEFLTGTVNGGYCLPVLAYYQERPNNYNMLSLVTTFYDNGEQGIWLNGSNLNNTFSCASENNSYPTTYNIGGGPNNISMKYNYAETIVFTSNLSRVDRQRVEGYLAWKWGLRNLLPADHPYKNASP